MRPIDRHEDAIVDVLDSIDGGVSYLDARDQTADEYGLTRDRLDSLVRTWCAVAGMPFPGDIAATGPGGELVEEGSMMAPPHRDLTDPGVV